MKSPNDAFLRTYPRRLATINFTLNFIMTYVIVCAALHWTDVSQNSQHFGTADSCQLQNKAYHEHKNIPFLFAAANIKACNKRA